MSAAEMTPEEFKDLCDMIMTAAHANMVGALTAWCQGNTTGLPVVIQEVRATSGRTAVVSRDELAGQLSGIDLAREAVLEAVNGPRDRIPVVLAFVEKGFCHTVWIEPISESEVQ